MSNANELREAANDILNRAERVLAKDSTPILDAAVMLARARLAEHPADDEQPVDADWLDAIGRRFDSSTRTWGIGERYGACIYVSDKPPASDPIPYVAVTSSSTWSKAVPVPTRGHVRRLCAALCVPLKDGVSP